MSTAAEQRVEEVKRLERREGWKRRLPVLPALLFTIFVTQIPFLFTLYYSLTDWRIDKPEPRKVIGFDNYAGLIDDSFFRQAGWVSVQMTVMAVLFSLIVGTGLALLVSIRSSSPPATRWPRSWWFSCGSGVHS